jgi:NADH-quinone oxidoreductase subunit L
MGDYMTSAGIFIDRLTMLMVVVVSSISFLVHVYSTGYMAGDTAIRRYFAMLGFFTFSMLGVVLTDNLLMIFFFWELVGFSSYMLIGHWTELPEAGAASKKAFILNRIGDVGFIIGLMIVYSQTGTLHLNFMEGQGGYSWQTTASLCFFAGIIGKSAQFPLLTWLPDAMAGPTPVSALIHAATMVAAGVFLLARIHFLFTVDSLTIVTIVGVLTSLLGATAALVHYDIKKILAYSTISQLGFMMIGMGINAKDSAILHLFTHAFFKAGLFLAAGSVIHAMHQAQQNYTHFDVQDIRNLGGLRRHLPLTFTAFLICGSSLAGIPFFSGFQSKDSILHFLTVWSGTSFSWKWIIVAMVFLLTFLTVCYTFRLIWYTFFRPASLLRGEHLIVTEPPAAMRIPIVILAVCSFWWIVSLNPFDFSGWWLEGTSSHLITLISGAWVLFAFAVSYLVFRNRKLRSKPNQLAEFLASTLFLDRLFRHLTNQIQRLSGLTLLTDKKIIDVIIHATAYVQVTIAHIVSWFDRNFIDGTVNGVAYFSRGVGRLARSTQGGMIQIYIFWAGLALTGLLVYLIF